MSFKSHEPKRIIGLVIGAGEINSLPWPAPNRNLVTKCTREHEVKTGGYHRECAIALRYSKTWKTWRDVVGATIRAECG